MLDTYAQQGRRCRGQRCANMLLAGRMGEQKRRGHRQQHHKRGRPAHVTQWQAQTIQPQKLPTQPFSNAVSLAKETALLKSKGS